MAEFRMVADICFEAEDLDDAFSKLHQHFEALDALEDVEADDVIDYVGTMEIALKDDEKINWQTGEISG